jgi:hypothetical protein
MRTSPAEQEDDPGKGDRGRRGRQIIYLAKLERNRLALCVSGLHVALQVDIEKFKHEVELLIRVDNIQQPGDSTASVINQPQRRWSRIGYAPNDIVILELFEQRDLADRGTRYPFVLRLEPDLLERDDLICADVTRFVHDAIGACCVCVR